MKHKHGYAKANDVHPLYKLWGNMIQRCTNPKNTSYNDYGARGIAVCDEWLNDSKTFIEWAMDNGWNELLCIDREDNNKGYSPDNCRFISRAENNKNQRLIKSSNTSGYCGVSYHKKDKKFVSKVKNNNKTVNIGSFDTAMDAAIARDKYVLANDVGLPLNFMDDGLLGRQEADAIEDWLMVNEYELYQSGYREADTVKKGESSFWHQHRINRIRWCIKQLEDRDE